MMKSICIFTLIFALGHGRLAVEGQELTREEDDAITTIKSDPGRAIQTPIQGPDEPEMR